MQQKTITCQQMVKAIRDAVRKEAKNQSVFVPGAIKISFMPATKEADDFLGGFSDKGDDAMYEFSYALFPELDFMTKVSSDYAEIHVKKKKLLTGNQTEGATERVYSWDDFLDITVRVFGADTKGLTLARAAHGAIEPFFSERSVDFSVTLDDRRGNL